VFDRDVERPASGPNRSIARSQLAAHASDSRLIAGLGAGAPVAVAAALVPARSWLGAANVALVLALVVVAVASLAGRSAGVVTSLLAALSFDFFHTRPYGDLRMDHHEDVLSVVLLLLLGLVVGELSARRDASRLAATTNAASAAALEDVAAAVVTGNLARTGRLPGTQHRFAPGGLELPPGGVDIAVTHASRLLGRIVLVPQPGRGTSKPQRRAAVALADQLAVVAARTPVLHPLS
jgi:Domain of unknown function (DUF4118)